MSAETQRGEQASSTPQTDRLKEAKEIINAAVREVAAAHPQWPMSRIRAEAFEKARPLLPEHTTLKSRRERRHSR